MPHAATSSVPLLPVLGGGIVALALAAWGLMKQRGWLKPEGAWQVEAVDSLLSSSEPALYAELVAIAGDLGFLVLPKVGLGELFRDKHDADRTQSTRYAAMHVDYVLVKREDFRPVAGIDLEGQAGSEASSQATHDAKKAALFKAARLPLLHIYQATGYTRESLIAKLEDALGKEALGLRREALQPPTPRPKRPGF